MTQNTELPKEWNMNTADIKRGGARPGAGRPRTRYHNQSMTVSVSKRCIEEARALRSRGIKVNKLIEAAIQAAWDREFRQDL